MRLGYACLALGVPGTRFRTCILKNISRDKLHSLIENNLLSLSNILKYNVENDITLFRLSSELIPFGSSIHNDIDWQELYRDKFHLLSSYIKDNNIRVSMHPGQFTIINSPREEVFFNAYQDLIYHCKVLDSLKTDFSSKIILHIGGIYKDKESATNRFIFNFSRLDACIKNRIAIENDDRYYNIIDVLDISKKLNIPVVYDRFHNLNNPVDRTKDDKYWIELASKTWQAFDGTPKIHYSQQAHGKRIGSHSQNILADDFVEFYKNISEFNVDIMLEVKDKNISCIKCKNLIESSNIINLEIEWSRYKYHILERSPVLYNEIKELLKNQGANTSYQFYKKIEEANSIEPLIGTSVNAAHHIWGYFKTFATEKEYIKFNLYLKKFSKKKLSILALKNYLYDLAIRYNQEYLLESYYFIMSDIQSCILHE